MGKHNRNVSFMKVVFLTLYLRLGMFFPYDIGNITKTF